MRTINRFFAAARILGACAVAALLTIAAAPQAMAQTDTDFTAITTTPASGTTVPGFFEVTYQFTIPDGDDDDSDPDVVQVSGFAPSDFTVTDTNDVSVGTVQSIRRNPSTNTYTVRIRANSDHNDETGETGALTVTLLANSVEGPRRDLNDPVTPGDATDDTQYTNTGDTTLSLTVDQIKPTVEFQVQTADGATNDADNLVNGKFRVQFTFNEAVTGFALSDISAPGMTKSNFIEGVGGNALVYSADFMPAAGVSSDVKITIPGGAVNDAVGNLNESDDIDVMVDQTKPTVTRIMAPTQWGNEDFMASVTFSENVNAFDTGDITITATPATETGTTATIGAGVLNADGTETFPVTFSSISAATTQLVISVAADVAFDMAGISSTAGDNGNGNAASTAIFNATVMIDDERPTISIPDTAFTPTLNAVTGIDLSPEDVSMFTATITFSEAVIGFQQGGNDITVSKGTVTLAGPLPGTSFTATITPPAGYEGEMTISIPAGAAMASADNAKTNPAFSRTVRINQGAPTVKVEAEKSRTKGPFGITITFSEAVTGFMMDEITIVDTASTSAEVSNFAGAGTTYTATVTPSDDAVGTPGSETAITISVAADAAMDIVGNTNTASDAGDNTNPVVTFDDEAPTVAISAPGSASEAFTATFTFSENITDGSFTVGDITVGNGAASNVQGRDAQYTATITPTANFNGKLTINVAADRVTDIAGNGNMAFDAVLDVEGDPATQGSQPFEVTIDQVAPTATIEDTTPPGQRKENDAFTITMTFSEAVTGLTTDGIAVSSSDTGKADDPNTEDVDESQLADATVTSVSGGGTSWTAVITPRAPADDATDQADTPLVDESEPFQGDLTVQVKADAAADSSAGGNTASNILIVNIDTVHPVLTISTSDSRGAGTNFNGAFTATFMFADDEGNSEDVTGFSADDLTFTQTGTNSGTLPVVSDFAGAGARYTATITPTPDNAATTDADESFQGTVTITVAADAVQDLHGNGNLVYDSDTDDGEDDADVYSVTIDTTGPVPVIGALPTNAGTRRQFGHAQDLPYIVYFTNGVVSTPATTDAEEVTGLMASDFTFKYVTSYAVTSDEPTFTPRNDYFGEMDGGATVAVNDIVASPSETDHTYTVTINPDPFSLPAVRTVEEVDHDDDTATAAITETWTPQHRELRIFINADKVADLAGNNNVILPDQDTGTDGDQNYRAVVLIPDVPAIVISTPTLTRTAFDDNPLSDGKPFTVNFVFSGVSSIGVFDVGDVTIQEGGTTVTGRISKFSGSGTSYSATITPTPDPTPDNDTEDGFNGVLTISVPENTAFSSVATSHNVYVDQRTPVATTITGPFLQDEGMRSANAATLPTSINGDPFYVQVTFSEQVENLGPSGFDIYAMTDAATTKTQVGTASNITAEDIADGETTQTWTAKITPNANFNGNLVVAVKAGAAMDRAGRDSTLGDPAPVLGATVGSEITVDQRGPVPVITFTATSHGNRELTAGDPTTQILHNVITATELTDGSFELTARFQNGNQTDDANMPVYEAVTDQIDGEDNFTLDDVVVSPTGAATVTVAVGTAPAWTITVTPKPDDTNTTDVNEAYEGPITISIPASRLADGVGNMNAASNSFTVVIDRAAPKVTAITGMPGETVAPDQPFSLKVTFSEDVTGFGVNPDGTLDADDVSIALYTTDTVDAALASPIDNAITGDPPTTTLSFLKFEPITGSKRNYKVTIRLNSANSAVSAANATKIAAYVQAGSAQDSAGNPNPTSWTADTTDTDVTFTANINHDRLVATIISGGPSVADGITGGPTETADDADSMRVGSTHTDGSYWFRFTFNQLVEGFTETDFEVDNGAVVAGSLEKSSAAAAANKVYYARFTATRVGDLVVSLPAGSVTDGASNPSLPSSYSLDVGRPRATIKIFAASDTTYLDANQLTGPQNGQFKAVVQFNEAINNDDKDADGSGTDNDKELPLSFRGASQSGGAWSTTSAGDRYIATIAPDSSVGGNKDFNLVIGLATDAVRDTSQNGNAPVQKTVMVDQTVPTVKIEPTEIGNNIANGNVFTATFTFDELVTGFAEADIGSLSGGTLVAGSLTRALMDGTAVTDTAAPAQVYTVRIDPADGVTEVTFTLTAGAVMDLAENSVAATPHTIGVDTVMPTPVIAGPASVNGSFSITITFSDAPSATPLIGEDVTGFMLSDLNVTGGVASGFKALSKSMYQANIAPNAGVTQVAVDIAANAAQDGATNQSLAATQYVAAVDANLPHVTSIVTPAAAGGEFTATINFNEAVTGFDASDVTVTDGTVKPGSFTVITALSYSIMIVPTPAVPDDPLTTDMDESAPAFEGELSISVPAGAATAGTRQTVVSAVKFVRIDQTDPEVSSFVLNNGSPLSFNQFSFSVAITFNEDMNTATWAASDLTVSGGTVTSVGYTGSRTLTAIISSPAQQATVSLGANAVMDLAGNGNVAHVGGTIARATNNPTVSVIVVDGSLTRNASPFQIQVTFNQPVTGFVANDLTVTGGTADQFQAVSGQIYRARITPTSGQSSVAISVAANVAHNTGNLGNAVSNTLTVNISTSNRTVSITSAAQAPVSGPFNVNIAFSQNTGGFSTGDITVLNGRVTSLTYVSLSRNWVASITPTGPEVAVYLVQNVVNGGNAPSNVFRIQSNVGSSVPSGLSVSLTGQAAVKAGASTVNILFTRNGVGVPVTGFELSDLSVSPSSVALTNLTPHATDAGRYMVTVTPANDFEGVMTVTLAANAAIDDRGNNSPGGSFQTRVDSMPPTVAISGPTGTANGAVDLTITFSEPVTGFDAADLTVSGGTAGDITGSDAVYMATVTPAADYNGELTADIAADAAMDAAGNMSTAAEQYAVMIDQTPPTVALTGPEGPIKDEMIMIMIAFSEAVTGFELSDIVVGNGSASDLAADETMPGHYTAMVQADSGFEGMLTVDIAAGAAADMATNASMAAEQYAVEVVLDTSFTIALNQGLNMIHVPVKVDGLAMVSNLYDALGGSSDVLYILSLDGSGNFVAYVGIPGSSGDTALSDQTAVVVNMRTAKSVTFTGGLLDDTVSLTQGVNLIGVPRAGAVAMASEVAPDATAVLVLTTNSIGEAQFTLVIPNTPSDVPAAGGQGYIVVAAADDSITYTGEAWEDPEDAAMSAASTEAVKYDPTSTPVLLIEGLFAREDTQEPVNGLQVTIKNLRTGERIVDTAGLTAGSGRFVKPMIAPLRGNRYEEGDMLEVSVVDPSGTFGGLTPVRTVVGKDEIAVGRINIGRQLLSAVPYRSDLLPNYPNPFNPETWIPFDLAEASRTTITIYNAAGQTVRVLELGQLPAGQYRSRSKAAYWDGRNALGERVSSGLYFYRIEAGSFSALRRMVILK